MFRVVERSKERNDGYYHTPFCNMQTKSFDTLVFSLNEVDISDSCSICGAGKSYITSMSHFHTAKNKDRFHFTIDVLPCMTAANAYEIYGIEDTHITQLNKRYYITYIAVSDLAITDQLVVAEDCLHCYGYPPRKTIFFRVSLASNRLLLPEAFEPNTTAEYKYLWIFGSDFLPENTVGNPLLFGSSNHGKPISFRND